jgi:hypothetical protein
MLAVSSKLLLHYSETLILTSATRSHAPEEGILLLEIIFIIDIFSAVCSNWKLNKSRVICNRRVTLSK